MSVNHVSVMEPSCRVVEDLTSNGHRVEVQLDDYKSMMYDGSGFSDEYSSAADMCDFSQYLVTYPDCPI